MKGVLIAHVVEDKVGFFSLLGGGELLTKKDALEIAEDVVNGYDGSPKLFEPIDIFFVEGKKVPIEIKDGRKTVHFKRKKRIPKKKKK